MLIAEIHPFSISAPRADHHGRNQKPARPRAVLCLLPFALCCLLPACGGVPETFYYTVSEAGAAAGKADNHRGAPPDIILGVEKFSAEALYEDDRIIYRDAPFEVKYYHYRRWAAPPRALVTDEFIRQLRASSCCREVLPFPSSGRIDYVLTGRILAFEEWDREEKWHGRVALLLQIYEPATRRLVWSDVFQAETPAAKKLPAAVVEAINTSLQTCIADFLKALPELVSKRQ